MYKTFGYTFLGMLAWRKLLWNSKPNSKTSKNSYNGYHKAGDYADALDDFLSVLPNAIKSFNSKGEVY